MKISNADNQTVLVITIVAFFTTAFVSWLKADIPYWSLLLHERGFIWAEIPFLISYRMALVGLIDMGSSTLLLLFNYSAWKKRKLTRSFLTFLLVSLFISISLGFFIGYGIKQMEVNQYSIITMNMLYYILVELSSKVVWCMLGVFLGKVGQIISS